MENIRLNQYWWMMVLRGVFALVFGILALAWPGVTMEVLVLWFGIYVFLDGIFGILSSYQAAAHHEKWWLMLMNGVLGVFVGVYAFISPAAMLLILAIVIGAWALVTGILEIAAAFTGPWGCIGKWTLGLAGFFSILVGVLMFYNPLGAALSIVILIGAYATAFGILLMIMGFKIKNTNIELKIA